jgi:thiamine-phosphate pyrophosphorylase
MLIKINGQAAEVQDGQSIRELVVARELPANGLIIELNGVILQRELWAVTRLNSGDNLEIIRIIGGG